MLISVLINNYNYGQYLKECIDSVLNQTYQNFELIIVDDGSTDNSSLILDQYSVIDQRIKIIKKENSGQLSAFNAGFRASKGEIIFFLDADDLYTKNYLAFASSFYKERPDIDMLYVSLQRFGKDDSIFTKGEREVGYSICRAYFELLGETIDIGFANPTSTISIRRSSLASILPLDLELDWRMRADDCINRGCSLIGGKKYFSKKILVHYRVHGNNGFFGKKNGAYLKDNQFKYALKVDRFNRTMLEKNKIIIDSQLLYREYRLLPEIDLKLFKAYKAMLKEKPISLSYWKRFILSRRMAKRFKRFNKRK